MSMIPLHRLVEKCEYVEKRSCRVHRPSDDFICETLQCLAYGCSYTFIFQFVVSMIFYCRFISKDGYGLALHSVCIGIGINHV